MGYREPEGIEAKMRRSEGGEEREDAEDEAPTVVVLNKGDLTEEEVIWEHNGPSSFSHLSNRQRLRLIK